jgi:hypothetical protein
MKGITILCVLLFVTVFAVGCSGQNAPTALSESTPENSVSLAKGPPASSGPIVIRTETAFAVFYADPGAGISAVHGADMDEFCNGIVDFDIVKLQEIDVPEDANRIISLVHGHDVRTSVWPFTDFDCDLFTTTTPLATGTVDMVSTDNDVVVFLNPDNVNHNAFGWAAHGKLVGPNGEELNFSGHSKTVWDGIPGPDEFFKSTDVINLH